MSRTRRVGGTRDGRSYEASYNVARPWYKREAKPARKATTIKTRRHLKQWLHSADYEADPDPRPRRTGGWLSQ